MAEHSRRAGEWARFLAATVLLTLLYLGLEYVQMGVVHFAALRGWLGGDPQVEFADEARQVAARSAALEARLPAQHKLDAWGLGLRLGYASQWLGGYGSQPAETMRELRRPVEPTLAQARELAARLGVGPVDALRVRTAADFGNLTGRLEADEWGLAARIEAATSPRDRHLFQLGLHVGVMFASLEGGLDLLPVPPSRQIGRHAALAGLPAALWMPLARLDTSGDRAHTRQSYRDAAQALERELIAPSGALPATPEAASK